jgi:hypothetical protein
MVFITMIIGYKDLCIYYYKNLRIDFAYRFFLFTIFQCFLLLDLDIF